MQYWRAEQIAENLGVSISTVWRWSASGKLPKPKKLSKRVTVWNAADVQAAIEVLAGESAEQAEA
jgi:predicted DNA-binding transcriptional regulator AlpA